MLVVVVVVVVVPNFKKLRRFYLSGTSIYPSDRSILPALPPFPPPLSTWILSGVSTVRYV